LISATDRGKHPGTYSTGEMVGPRIKLDDVEKRKIMPLLGFELHLGRSAGNQ
jgi:hypothetical protein